MRSSPARPIDRLTEGIGTDIDVLIGSNAEEHALFLIPSGVIDFITDDLLDAALTLVGADPAPSAPPTGRPCRTPHPANCSSRY